MVATWTASLRYEFPYHPSHLHQKAAGMCCTGVWRQPANLLCALAVLASMTISTTQHVEPSVPLLSYLNHTVRSAFPGQCCPRVQSLTKFTIFLQSGRALRHMCDESHVSDCGSHVTIAIQPQTTCHIPELTWHDRCCQDPVA